MAEYVVAGALVLALLGMAEYVAAGGVALILSGFLIYAVSHPDKSSRVIPLPDDERR
ncbi:MAG: hypothetical protein M3Y49_16515 [Actinomycetota bacterium]|nr:hypothetical protein [Actinomycetota bacterium]